MSEHVGDREGTNRPPNPGVRREIELDAAPADVWNALTRPELLEQWFEAEVELDPRPGGAGRFTGTDGERRSARVDDVDEGRRLAFTWWSDEQIGEPATKVEFVLTPTRVGTRVVVTESPLIGRACAGTAGKRWAWRLELLALTLFSLALA